MCAVLAFSAEPARPTDPPPAAPLATSSHAVESRFERGPPLGPPQLRIGVAGWVIPVALAPRFEPGASHLHRYASRFNAVEINSSFYRPHRRATYERWAASVPGYFRFAIKMPKTITHELRLADCAAPLQRFAAEIAGLAEKRGPILVQLPPKLAFDFPLADRFFTQARQILGDPIVCEPRHPSWFTDQADVLLADHNIPRVAADPPLTPAAADPGGALDLAYFRLHGAPRTYWSDYPATTISRHVHRLRTLAIDGREAWTIFDNTAAGHAPANALTLLDDLDGKSA